MDISTLPKGFLEHLKIFKQRYEEGSDKKRRAHFMAHYRDVYQPDLLEKLSPGALAADLIVNDDSRLFKDFMEALDIILRFKLPEPIGALFKHHADERAKALSTMVYKLGSAVVNLMENFSDYLTEALSKIKNFKPESIANIGFEFDSCKNYDDLPEAIKREVDFKELLAASINNIRGEMHLVLDTKVEDDRKIEAEDILDDSLHRFLPPKHERVLLPWDYNQR